LDRAVTKISLIVEMENAALVSWSEVTESFGRLQRQLCDYAESISVQFEVILALPGSVEEGRELLAEIHCRFPQLTAIAKLDVVSVENGRYYELKNAGVAQSTGDVVVFLDSDCSIEPNWLVSLLAPFQHHGLHVVSGYTYLAHDDFISRTFALIWFFPLRDHDDRAGARRALNINNCAISGEWIRANQFEIDPGFKVSCTKLAAKISGDGIVIERVPAYAAHASLRGWRFVGWRAWVTGRDADRKHHDLRSTNIIVRLIGALKFNIKLGTRSLRRVVTRHRQVSMPWYEVPCALLLSAAFTSVTFLGQILHVFGFRAGQPEVIPAYAEHT
jgi:glycosyltransferase involved in cell wall biosynthesis